MSSCKKRKTYPSNVLPPLEVLVSDLFSYSFNQLRKHFHWTKEQMNEEYTTLHEKLCKDVPGYSQLDEPCQKLVLSVRAMQYLYNHTPEPDTSNRLVI